jgi:GT2 family glycosyltransferase
MSISKKISLVTVTYNSEETIYKLLTSLKLIEDQLKEVIIIDNNSKKFNSKKIKKISRKIKIIQNKTNTGFARAVNQGIKIAESDFILLLNPDTYIEDKSIIKTINKIKNNTKIGAIGGFILNEKGERQFTANNKPSFMTALFEFSILKRIFPNNKYSKEFWVENKKIKKPINVSSLCGAYIILRKIINNELNLFDENFFLYLEDIDIGISINNKQYLVKFDPDSHVKHVGGASSNNKYKMDLNSWYKSRKIFFKKHQSKFKGIIITVIFSIEEFILKKINYIKNEKTSKPSLPPPSNPQRIKKSRKEL